ncbi:MMPL family transporter [Nakamurella sp. A5-74]|uniref:MMPL family transporter n=1 Tax=Nakamurella sp. A5-74 TaxID=3158264 RepID=A0AAU8DPC9_9ACTN
MPDPATGWAPRPTRNRIVVALGFVLIIGGWLAVSGIGGPKIGQLSQVQSNNSTSFLPASAESVRAATQAAEFSPAKTIPAFVLFSSDGVASAEQLTAWNAAAAALGAAPVTADGATLGTITDYLPDGAKIVPIPSQDGAAILAVVPLAEAKLVRTAEGQDPPLTLVVDSLRAAAAPSAAGGNTHVTGPAGLVRDLGGAFAGIDGILLLVALGVVLLILLLVYRALALPVFVLFSSVCCLALAGWIVYLLADADVITLNGQSQGILFILVIGAATDYGLLLTARYREELTRIQRPIDAMKVAWRACLEPIAASAATVIIGLLCLLLSDLNSNRSLGPVAAIGIACAFLGTITLLPTLLATGRWVFWPRVPALPAAASAAAPAAHRAAHAAEPEEDGPLQGTGLWVRIARTIGAHPRRVWVVTGIVLLAMCAALPTFKGSGVQQSEVFLGNPDSVVGQQDLEKHFPGGTGNPVVIVVPEALAGQVIAAAQQVPGLTGAPVAQGAAQGSAATVVDGRVLLDATLSAGADTTDAKDTIRALRAALHPLGAVLVGGQTAQQLDTSDTAARDLRVIIPAVLLAVLLVLMLLLRSLVAPLVLVVATVISFGSALGVSALVFNHVLDFPGADPAVPLFGFVFLVALGVDYSIFLMSRAREESLLLGPRAGILAALVTTGGVITSAGVVLAATFAALGIIPILFLAQIAFIVCFGVLLDTLVVRSLLVSAIATDLGRLIWWPSKLGRRATGGRHETGGKHEASADPGRVRTS